MHVAERTNNRVVSDSSLASKLAEKGGETEMLKVDFRCLRCGKCCDHERDAYAEDIERWIGEERYDILEHVFCYPRSAFCANVLPHPCQDCSKTEKVIVNRSDSTECPFLRKVRNKTYYECIIHSTKPKDCADWICRMP